MRNSRLGMAAICGVAAALMAAAITPALITPALAAKLKLRNAAIEPLSFAVLDGWKEDDHAAAFGAYLKSCDAIRHGTKAMRRARPVYDGLYQACMRALDAGPLDREQARKFFEENFQPARIVPNGESDGFFTGYYESVIEGSRFPSHEYTVPIYGQPSDLVKSRNGRFFRKAGKKYVPYHDRTEIVEGALAGRGLEICWVKNPIDAFFAQIQGSTRVKLESGKMLRLNYAASNGMPYTAVGKFLIDRGVYTREEMSMDKIRAFMEADPKEGEALRRMNRSFVFFRETGLKPNEECIGAQGVPLTPGRSLAVDRKLHVYGTPIWVEAELPIESEVPETPFRRLLIAQDTGSAIEGPARADIYFGSGEAIGSVAGRIKQFGRFVMLVPSTVDPGKSEQIPVPKPNPRAAVMADNTGSVGSGSAPGKPVPLPKRRPQT